MKILPIIYGVILIASITTILLASSSDSVFASKRTCERLHSCPSDNGKYTCGDWGYCTQCPDNQYCKAGKPWSGSSSSSSKSQSGSSYSNSSYSASKSTTSQFTGCKGTAQCITSKVTKIIDGDTIQIEKYKIRLSLTNTPEINQNGYSQATAFTTKLCPVGSYITVDQDDTQKFDVYNRLLGKVYCGGKSLNSELLYNGYANILTQYCKKSEFAKEDWAIKYGCSSKSTSPAYTPAPVQPTPVQPTPKQNSCDPSYPTVCIPSPPPDLDCGDIPYTNFRVLQPDPHRFDADKDGIGCEKSSSSTPVPPTPAPVPPTPAPEPPVTKVSSCDSSYPDFCIPPPPPDLDCKDIPQKNFTVLQPDPHHFDGDKDGIGCES